MLSKRKTKKFGYIPDLMSSLDFQPTFQIRRLEALPPVVDLRNQYPAIPILNQQLLGSCVAHGTAVAHMAAQVRASGKVYVSPSRLFIYYNARAVQGWETIDSGCMIRDAIKSIASEGAPPESNWPYLIKSFATKPNTVAYREAMKFQSLKYERLNNANLASLLSCLAEGFPFVFGYAVYPSFESSRVARTGIYEPDPSKEGRPIGGHCCAAWGYDKAKQTFLVRNSWGNWGKGGYFTMRFRDMCDTNMTEDVWRILLVEK